MNSKIIWYLGGILTATAIGCAVIAGISAGNGERGSGRKSFDNPPVLLAASNGDTQPSEPRGDRSPDPGKGRRD